MVPAVASCYRECMAEPHTQSEETYPTLEAVARLLIEHEEARAADEEQLGKEE